MSTALPEHIDPWKLARYGELLAGELPPAGLSRLRESVDGGEPVAVRLQFGIDAEGRAFIEGDINTEVRLTCQRCLQSMPYALRAQVSLGLLRPGQSEAGLPAGREALEVTATPLSLAELVEDELILALPVIACHESCPDNEYMLQETDSAPDEAADNPFAVLQQLKR